MTQSPSGNHLKARGVILRDRVEAQIKAVSRHEKRPFSGDENEKAYLMGLRYGDLHVVKHGRAVRVRVSTTHPAMADLFESLFSPYGHVLRYPRKARLVAFEWTLECDLDGSFEFFLLKPSLPILDNLTDSQFMDFLAGLFDAEGSVFLHKKRGRHNPEVVITNSDRLLVGFVFARLRGLGYSANVQWRRQQYSRDGISGESIMGRVTVWRFKEVQEILKPMPIRHVERTSKAQVIRRLRFGASDAEQPALFEEWERVQQAIRSGRTMFSSAAARELAKEIGQAKTL